MNVSEMEKLINACISKNDIYQCKHINQFCDIYQCKHIDIYHKICGYLINTAGNYSLRCMLP